MMKRRTDPVGDTTGRYRRFWTTLKRMKNRTAIDGRLRSGMSRSSIGNHLASFFVILQPSETGRPRSPQITQLTQIKTTRLSSACICVICGPLGNFSFVLFHLAELLPFFLFFYGLFLFFPSLFFAFGFLFFLPAPLRAPLNF